MESRSLHLVDGTFALSPSSALEAEFAKDRWDARNIVGLRYATHTSQYHIHFQSVPKCFQGIVAEYTLPSVPQCESASSIWKHLAAFILDKYWLVGDIQKTRVLGHKIPITREVAHLLQAQIVWVQQHYRPQENPHGWLFPASKDYQQGRSRRFLLGDPLAAGAIRDRLNYLTRRCQIQDEQGNLFHFRLQAFRHTKAIELINNGMSLVLVQQWMAHASPEMTLIYAKILDETMRTQSESEEPG